MDTVSSAHIVQNILESDQQFMELLFMIHTTIQQPWCVFGGQVRNTVWDSISDSPGEHISRDVDIGIFLPNDTQAAASYEARLYECAPHQEWDVENFAVSHIENHDMPYDDLTDGLRKQLMTVMSVGVTLAPNGEASLITPLGVDDLMNCIVRPTPIILDNPDRLHLITETIQRKEWQHKWPALKVIL